MALRLCWTVYRLVKNQLLGESMRRLHAIRALLLATSSVAAATSWTGRAAAQQLQATPNGGDVKGAASAPPSSAPGNAANQISEVVVTATRQRELLSRVPASISAFTQKTVEIQGLKDIRGIQQFTPDLQLTTSASAGPAASPSSANVAIRGISSTVGSATTGIYIDDTPIQVRQNGFTSRNTFPTLYDLERIEVLRGPQGTLFGSGSEGGAIRFITPEPNLRNFSTYERVEGSETQSGGPSGEVGAAVGGPIVEDKLGFRLSAYVRHDGGYVDHEDFFTKQITDRNSNYQNTLALRGALTWAPTGWLTLTPSILYEQVHFNDLSNYWLQASDASKGRFINENQGETPDQQHFALYALRAEAALGQARLISNTSYYMRRENADVDFTELDVETSGFPAGANNYPGEPGPEDTSLQRDTQENFTEELRLQKANPDTMFNYTIGVFYSEDRQVDNQQELTGQLEDLFVKNFGLNFEQALGAPSYQGLYSYVDEVGSREKQFAVFGQFDLRPTPKLKLTAGVRYTRDTLRYSEFVAGPFAFPAGTTTGSFGTSPFTPKFGATYTFNPDNLLYANAAKGFRPGGVQAEVPANACSADLQNLGITQSPSTYDSDSVWSYEAGSKNRLMNGRLSLDGSVYYIDWSNIQQAVPLTSCGESFTSNLGSATSKGVDLTAALKLTSNISLGIAVGYNDARYNDTEQSGKALIVAKDDRINLIPFTGSTYGQYSFHVLDRPAFARLDYVFNDGGTSPDRLAQGYKPQLPNLPVTNLVNLRIGVYSGPVLVSLFLNNAFNSAPQTETAYTKRTQLIYGTTERPRTAGLTASYSF